MSKYMYDCIALETAIPGSKLRFLGDRTQCRYCRTKDTNAFGKRKNAHAFPAALGNRVLFSLDECKACNAKFSNYEDSLCKAIGPLLTIGGVKGSSRVRNTGRTGSKSTIRHAMNCGKKQLSIYVNLVGSKWEGSMNGLIGYDSATGLLRLVMPIEGDHFVPLHAYKALVKIGVSLLPTTKLPKFSEVISSLSELNDMPHAGHSIVGLSYAYAGNSFPMCSGILLRRKDIRAHAPYMIFLLLAGPVCCQICLRSDDLDEHVPDNSHLALRFTAQIPMTDDSYFPIEYCTPLAFNWADLTPILQPFKEIEWNFNPKTAEGFLKPIPRDHSPPDSWMQKWIIDEFRIREYSHEDQSFQ